MLFERLVGWCLYAPGNLSPPYFILPRRATAQNPAGIRRCGVLRLFLWGGVGWVVETAMGRKLTRTGVVRVLGGGGIIIFIRCDAGGR